MSSIKEFASFFIRDSKKIESLRLCTHLAVGAHQDDLEIMASHGILECKESREKEFVGVVCTSGSGSARSGEFKDYTDEQMREVRKLEQMKSAQLGKYLSLVQLSLESSEIKRKWNKNFVNQLKEIVIKTQPQVIYTHNIADKHETHIAVAVHMIEALRELQYKPQEFVGCEVWRGLDWLPDQSKVAMEISNPQFVKELIDCHQSQTKGGKAYGEATLGRMNSNATFFESHKVDFAKNLIFSMNLMPLLEHSEMSCVEFVSSHIEQFKNEVCGSLSSYVKGE